jgi:hypothetical protein
MRIVRIPCADYRAKGICNSTVVFAEKLIRGVLNCALSSRGTSIVVMQTLEQRKRNDFSFISFFRTCSLFQCFAREACECRDKEW